MMVDKSVVCFEIVFVCFLCVRCAHAFPEDKMCICLCCGCMCMIGVWLRIDCVCVCVDNLRMVVYDV